LYWCTRWRRPTLCPGVGSDVQKAAGRGYAALGYAIAEAHRGQRKTGEDVQKFSAGVEVIPATTSWYLADLGEAGGKQELFTKLSPQTLKARREHALIESAVSSNRIAGVLADQARVGTIVFGHKQLRDRAEEEIGGYRDALKWIHGQGPKLLISEETIRELHRLTTGGIGDASITKKRIRTSSRNRPMVGKEFASRPFQRVKPLQRCVSSFHCGRTASKSAESIH
jgi:hypothetical protein